MNRLFIAMLVLFAVSGCNGSDSKDYDAAARCQALVYKPGSKEYDNCMHEEKMQKMMQQQRQEYEKMKQDDMDWKLRGRY